MMCSFLHEQTKQFRGKVSFMRCVLIRKGCLFGELGHLENLGHSGCNSLYTRYPLIWGVRRQYDVWNLLYNACVGMRGATKIEFGMDLQGTCQHEIKDCPGVLSHTHSSGNMATNSTLRVDTNRVKNHHNIE